MLTDVIAQFFLVAGISFVSVPSIIPTAFNDVNFFEFFLPDVTAENTASSCACTVKRIKHTLKSIFKANQENYKAQAVVFCLW